MICVSRHPYVVTQYNKIKPPSHPWGNERGVGGREGTHFLMSNLLKGYNLKSKTYVLELFLHSIITLLPDNQYVEIHSRKFSLSMYINIIRHQRPYPQTSSSLGGLRCRCCCCTTIWFGTFSFIIFNSSLDSILSKHAAVQLYWWQRKIFCNFPEDIQKSVI